MVTLMQIGFSLILAFFGIQILRCIEWRAMWRRGRIQLVQRPINNVHVILVGLLVGGFFGINALGVVLLKTGMIPADAMENMSDVELISSILFTMFMQAVFVIACFLSNAVTKQSASRTYGFGQIRFRHAVVLSFGLIFASLPLVVLASLCNMGLVWGLDQTIGYEPGPQDAVRLLTNASSSPVLAVLMVITAVIGAPVSEEFTFRGVFLPYCCRTFGFWPGFILVSLAFGIMHVHFPSVLPLSMLGAVFAVGYILSRSIVVPILMHFFFNGFNVAMIFLFPEQVAQTTQTTLDSLVPLDPSATLACLDSLTTIGGLGL